MGASQEHFAPLVTSLAALGRIFRVFGRFGIDSGGFGASKTMVWEAKISRFSMVFHASERTSLKCFECYKTTIFLWFPPSSTISHLLNNDFKNDFKLLQGPVAQTFPSESCSKLVSGLAELGFVATWDPLGLLLDATWPAFGRSGTALGLSWMLLGCLCGDS